MSTIAECQTYIGLLESNLKPLTSPHITVYCPSVGYKGLNDVHLADQAIYGTETVRYFNKEGILIARLVTDLLFSSLFLFSLIKILFLFLFLTFFFKPPFPYLSPSI